MANIKNDKYYVTYIDQ